MQNKITPQVNLNVNQNIAELNGELLFDSVMLVRQQGLNFIHEQAKPVFDFSHTSKADSAALALLLDWYRAALSQQKEIQFMNLPESMQSLIKVANLSDVLNACIWAQ